MSKSRKKSDHPIYFKKPFGRIDADALDVSNWLRIYDPKLADEFWKKAQLVEKKLDIKLKKHELKLNQYKEQNKSEDIEELKKAAEDFKKEIAKDLLEKRNKAISPLSKLSAICIALFFGTLGVLLIQSAYLSQDPFLILLKLFGAAIAIFVIIGFLKIIFYNRNKK